MLRVISGINRKSATKSALTVTKAENHSEDQENRMVIEYQRRIAPVKTAVVIPQPNYAYYNRRESKKLEFNTK